MSWTEYWSWWWKNSEVGLLAWFALVVILVIGVGDASGCGIILIDEFLSAQQPIVQCSISVLLKETSGDDYSTQSAMKMLVSCSTVPLRFEAQTSRLPSEENIGKASKPG